MFDMGFLEMLLIGIIALIVLGPERLPRAARTVGMWVARARHGFDSLKSEIDRELHIKDLQKKLEEEKAQIESEFKGEDNEFNSIKEDIKEVSDNFHSTVSSLEEATSSVDSIIEDKQVSNKEAASSKKIASDS